MKKNILMLSITLLTSSLSAQFVSTLKLGISNHTNDNNSITSISTSPVFYTQISGGYRFFDNEHITLVPKLFFSKSGFILQDLTFGSPNNNGFFEISDISYRLYNVGLNIGTEIKLLNLEKKANFYITPNITYRRVFYFEAIPSNPNLGEKESSSNIQQNFILDWGIELGIKLQKFKFGLSYHDALNKGNKNNSSFVITNSFSFSVSFFFGKNSNNIKSTE